MSVRGRGRGRGFFNRPLFPGSNPEDRLPRICQPPPLFPPLKFKPVPLPSGKKISALLNYKQEIRSAFRESAYYIPPVSTKKDIERYTDKYQQIQAADEIEWDKSRFPKELFEEPAKKKRKIIKKATKKEAVVEKLKVLEAKEETEDKEKDENEESEQDVENEEDEYDDELEEETDYANNYFDNGENYLDEEDDNLDEGYE